MKYKDGKPYAIIEDKPEDDLAPESNQHMMSLLNKINNVGAVFNKSYYQKRCEGF